MFSGAYQPSVLASDDLEGSSHGQPAVKRSYSIELRTSQALIHDEDLCAMCYLRAMTMAGKA